MSAIRWGAEALASTWTFRVTGEGPVDRLRAARQPLVYLVWHSGLLPALWKHRGEQITLLVSGHRDGARLASAARHWGFETVTGSSTRGGARGLRGIVRALHEGRRAAFTPDGPRGPSRRVKPGAVLAAQATGAWVVPVGVAAHRAWRLGSWDRMLIPRPFAAVGIAYGVPFTIPPGMTHRETGLQQVQEALETVTRAACSA